MIIELIQKYKKVALVCSCFEHIEHLLDLCKSDGITFTKRLSATDIYTESWDDLYKKYTGHLSPNYKSAILIELGDLGDINIYTRSYKDWGKHDDWEKYHFIDYSAHIREEKIEQIIGI